VINCYCRNNQTVPSPPFLEQKGLPEQKMFRSMVTLRIYRNQSVFRELTAAKIDKTTADGEQSNFATAAACCC
jgi:hypothetical protein